MHNFKELKIWQQSKDFVKVVYGITKNFPNEELFGLVSQMNRAAISIPSNIAEGAGRDSDRDFARFLKIALSSTYELETQIIISADLGFITDQIQLNALETLRQIQKVIISFIRNILTNG